MENFINEVLQVLQSTLSPECVKKAQSQIEQLSLKQGYSHALLEIMSNDSYSSHIRNASAAALKNFIKANWAEGDAPLLEDEREGLRVNLLAKAFQMPPFLREQTSEIVCQISKVDFPQKWVRLIEVIAEQLSGNAPFDQLVSALTTLDQLVVRYRHEMRSDPLWLEIIVVVNAVAEPLTLLNKQMLSHAYGVMGTATSDTLSLSDRSHWLQIMLLLTRIFHSLVAQDISPYLEENLAVWMEGFLTLLGVNLPQSIEQSQLDHEPSDLERLKTEICDVATLFSQRFEDLFGNYTQNFIESIWQLLNITDTRIRFDAFVNAALGFLAAICQRPHYKAVFEMEGVLKGICEGVIIKNLLLRKEDVDIYENEPFEFLRRDIEGSDLETRRRGASDFVRALCQNFEAQVFQILSQAIGQFLGEYAQDQTRNIAKKDVVYFLVTAMASRGTTNRHGSTSISELINVSDFFTQHVLIDLTDGGQDERPLLRGDALKFLVLFRNQLAPALIVECVRGASPSNPLNPGRSIIRFLSSQHVILHHYVSYALERLFQLRATGTGIWHQMSILNSENIPLGDLIDALFNCFQINQAAYETHYIMKALMRCFLLINDDQAKGAHVYVQRLAVMIESAIRTPINPLFIHYVFESLCVLVRRAYSKAEGGLDKSLLPVIEAILISEAAADFTAYALQLIAILIEQCHAERQQGIDVDESQYANFFPALLRVEFWARPANFPALVRVFEAFIRCLPTIVFQNSNANQVLGIYQKLISSKANDQHGFKLASALIPHLDQSESSLSSKQILLTMLNRLNQTKTSKCAKQFALFFFRYAALRGGQTLASALNDITAGLFIMVTEKLVLPEVRQMPQTTTANEKRVVAIGASTLISDTVQLLGDQLYALLVGDVVAMLEALRLQQSLTENGEGHVHVAGTIFGDALPDEPADGQQELEYNDPYSKLAFAQQNQAIHPHIHNIKKHFAQAVLVTAQSASPNSLACISDVVKNCLQGYINSV